MSDQLYQERTERKFGIEIGRERLRQLKQDIAARLPIQEFFPREPVTINNTIYFDSADCKLLRQELASRFDHIRIRARKYEYDRNGLPSPYWIEYKIRKGDLRKKRRLKLKDGHFQNFVGGKKIEQEVLQYNRSFSDINGFHSLYGEIQRIIRENDLKPVLLVRYFMKRARNEYRWIGIFDIIRLTPPSFDLNP